MAILATWLSGHWLPSHTYPPLSLWTRSPLHHPDISTTAECIAATNGAVIPVRSGVMWLGLENKGEVSPFGLVLKPISASHLYPKHTFNTFFPLSKCAETDADHVKWTTLPLVTHSREAPYYCLAESKHSNEIICVSWCAVYKCDTTTFTYVQENLLIEHGLLFLGVFVNKSFECFPSGNGCIHAGWNLNSNLICSRCWTWNRSASPGPPGPLQKW